MVGRAIDGATGFVVVEVVGAGEVGAVGDAARGELLLHAPSTTTPQMIGPRGSFRIEASVEAGGAYDRSPMRYVVFVPDGCADVPLDELDGRTPLEAARMPRLSELAARGDVGRAEVIPPGLPPGSDVGNMAILGFDPVRYHTGRAPIEAAAMGVELAPDEVAYRCNLVTVSDDVPPVMVDFAAGHLPSAQSHPIVAALEAALGGGRDGVRFHPGVEYRHLCVVPGEWAEAHCTPPHDITGMPIELPSGPAAPKLRSLMDASRAVVRAAAHDVGASATQIWLWGQGVKPALPSFDSTYGVAGRMSSAVDLVQGLGVLTGIEVVDVPGATAGFDNDYAAQARACLRSLEDRDLFVLHIEATDEAGHQGLPHVKVDALERWDRDVIGPIVDALAAGPEPFRILLLPDHATPCTIKTHTAESVPYLLFDSARDAAGGVYTEPATAHHRPVPAHALMGRLLAPA